MAAEGVAKNHKEKMRAARSLVHPPSQEATARRPWRNAQRVSSEALAKEDMFPAFVACGYFGGVGSARCRRRLKRSHGWQAVGLHDMLQFAR